MVPGYLFQSVEFDALILTFAHPVTVPEYRPRYRQLQVEYDPFRETNVSNVSDYSYDYNPFASAEN